MVRRHVSAIVEANLGAAAPAPDSGPGVVHSWLHAGAVTAVNCVAQGTARLAAGSGWAAATAVAGGARAAARAAGLASVTAHGIQLEATFAGMGQAPPLAPGDAAERELRSHMTAHEV